MTETIGLIQEKDEFPKEFEPNEIPGLCEKNIDKLLRNDIKNNYQLVSHLFRLNCDEEKFTDFLVSNNISHYDARICAANLKIKISNIHHKRVFNQYYCIII